MNTLPPQPDFRVHLDTPGPDFTITLDRTELARAGEEHFTTFSDESISTVAWQAEAWVTSRFVREAQRLAGTAPQLQVTVTVEFDVAPDVAELRFPLRPDGQPRMSMSAVAQRVDRWVRLQLAEIVTLEDRMPQALTLTIRAEAPPPVPSC